MKKIAVSMLIIGLFHACAFPFKFGLEFQAGEQQIAGANLRFSRLFELKPQLGFLISEPTTTFNIIVNGNFYLSNLGRIQQYTGLGADLVFRSDEDGIFGLDAHYGLRYDFNDFLSLFGQLGLGFILSPEFGLFTHTSGAGLTFYIF